VLLYLPWQKDKVVENAVASTKDTLRLVTPEERDERKQLVISTTRTDEKGNFEFSIAEKYGNASFDIDFICGTVPRIPPKPPRRQPIQFHITTFLPQWRLEREAQLQNVLAEPERHSYYYNWRYCIPSKWWCSIRGHYFDAWLICGQLVNCETGSPIVKKGRNQLKIDWLSFISTGNYLRKIEMNQF
jgi:hypothetical protein